LPLHRTFVISEALLSKEEIERVTAHILRTQESIDAELSPEEINDFVCDVISEKVGTINQRLYWQSNLSAPAIPTVTARQMLDMAFGRAKEILAAKGQEIKVTQDMKSIWPKLANYFAGVEGDLDLNKGILLIGGVGTGKTLTMQAFAANPRKSFIITPCEDVVRYYGEVGDEYVEKYTNYRRVMMPDVFQEKPKF